MNSYEPQDYLEVFGAAPAYSDVWTSLPVAFHRNCGYSHVALYFTHPIAVGLTAHNWQYIVIPHHASGWVTWKLIPGNWFLEIGYWVMVIGVTAGRDALRRHSGPC